jgi:DNA-binding transcriptional regulator YiaG
LSSESWYALPDCLAHIKIEEMQMTKTKIKKLRLKLRLTQKNLSEKLGVSVRTVQRWESGVTVPSKSESIALGFLK